MIVIEPVQEDLQLESPNSWQLQMVIQTTLEDMQRYQLETPTLDSFIKVELFNGTVSEQSASFVLVLRVVIS